MKQIIKLPKDFNKTYFIDIRNTSFSPKSNKWQEIINNQLYDIFKEIKPLNFNSPGLIKCHIGEPENITRMLPEFCASTVSFLKKHNVKNVVAGDTTVAYTGVRSHQSNPINNCSKYLNLAKSHGWDRHSKFGADFVVLDRPITSIKNVFDFKKQYIIKKGNFGRFKKIYSAGGFENAGVIYSHSHLTLHITAHIASAIKTIGMGMAPYIGKRLMHQHYCPNIDYKRCIKCETCIKSCPMKALEQNKQGFPSLISKKCIGCGECMANCKLISNAISMMSKNNMIGWNNDQDTLAYRVFDYAVGLMKDKFDKMIHIVHLYNITKYCDCFNRKFVPIFRDIGFLVGKNPFALDYYAKYLLSSELNKKKKYSMKDFNNNPFMLNKFYKNDEGIAPFEYINKAYHIPFQPDVTSIKL